MPALPVYVLTLPPSSCISGPPVIMMICLPPRDTSPRHQDSAGTAPGGTPPPAQPPPPPQTKGNTAPPPSLPVHALTLPTHPISQDRPCQPPSLLLHLAFTRYCFMSRRVSTNNSILCKHPLVRAPQFPPCPREFALSPSLCMS